MFYHQIKYSGTHMAHKGGGGVDQVNEILFRLSAYKTIKHSLFLFLFSFA